MKKQVDYRKVAQIVFIYGLALMAAVACGEAFPVKTISKNLVDPKPFAVEQQNIHAKKNNLKEGSGCDQTLDFSFVDETRTVKMQLCSSASKKDGTASGVSAITGVDDYQYEAVSLCADATCAQISVLITRTSTTTKLMKRFALLLEDGADEMNVVARQSDTKITNLADILKLPREAAKPAQAPETGAAPAPGSAPAPEVGAPAPAPAPAPEVASAPATSSAPSAELAPALPVDSPL